MKRPDFVAYYRVSTDRQGMSCLGIVNLALAAGSGQAVH